MIIPAKTSDLEIVNVIRESANVWTLLFQRTTERKKIKENEKRDKYLYLAREQKDLWNMRVVVILIVIVAFGTIPKVSLKGLEKSKIGGRIVPFQTIALLRSARILRRVLET